MYQTSTGGIYYSVEDGGDRRAAKILADKAAELFITAQERAGGKPCFLAGSSPASHWRT